MSKKIKIPKPTKCYIFTGQWRDGGLGWMGASHLGGSRRYPDYPRIDKERFNILEGDRLYLCEVIIKPVLNKKGSPITRIVNGKKAKVNSY